MEPENKERKTGRPWAEKSALVAAIRQSAEAASSSLSQVFFPPFCQHCGKEGAWLCVSCKETMPALPHAMCPHCGIRLVGGELLPLCARETGLARFLCAYEFKNTVVRSLVHAYKFRHGKILHFLLSSLLVDWLSAQAAFADLAPQELIVTSVPLSSRRRRERGFNQSELLARDLADAFGLQYKDTLARTKNAKPQTEMANNEERVRNIRGVFALSSAA